MEKKVVYKILLILGFVPFIVALLFGIYASINGFSGLSITNTHLGIEAFVEMVFLYSYLYWPTYIIGLILIVFSLLKIK